MAESSIPAGSAESVRKRVERLWARGRYEQAWKVASRAVYRGTRRLGYLGTFLHGCLTAEGAEEGVFLARCAFKAGGYELAWWEARTSLVTLSFYPKRARKYQRLVREARSIVRAAERKIHPLRLPEVRAEWQRCGLWEGLRNLYRESTRSGEDWRSLYERKLLLVDAYMNHFYDSKQQHRRFIKLLEKIRGAPRDWRVEDAWEGGKVFNRRFNWRVEDAWKAGKALREQRLQSEKRWKSLRSTAVRGCFIKLLFAGFMAYGGYVGAGLAPFPINLFLILIGMAAGALVAWLVVWLLSAVFGGQER